MIAGLIGGGIGLLFIAGLIALVVSSVKKAAKDELIREQATKSLEVDRERTQSDDEIKKLPDDDLAARLNRWT